MNYIILDLEWNQSSDNKQSDKVMPFEIVEIGAVKLNENKEVIGKFSELVKPQIYLELHYITKKLIHLRIEELQGEKYFAEVMTEFLKWCGEDYIFGTWGPLDLLELQRNMKFYNLPLLAMGPLKFLDIQKLFSITYDDGKTRRTLEHAVDSLGIMKEIPFHRAFSDAYYTGKVFEQMKNKTIEVNYSFDLYTLPKSRKEEIKVIFPNYSKYISREFEDRNMAMTDKEVITTRCYLCGRNAKRVIRWFAPNTKHYLSVSNCKDHGYIKGKIRIKRSEQDKIYVVKTLKFITESQIKEIRKKNRSSF